jgi:hypothetical protein
MKTEKYRTTFRIFPGQRLPFCLASVLLASQTWAWGIEQDTGSLDRLSKEDARALSQFATQIARQHLPHEYKDDRHWGMTRQRWDGLHLQWDRFQLKTKQRHKEVNHGLWRRFDVELIHPNREFEVQLSRIRQQPSGALAFDLRVRTPLRVTGRIARWNHGVQVLSISAEATAKVQLSVSARLRLSLDLSHTPPDVILEPIVDRAEIHLLEFEVDRVSKVGGEVAEQLGRASRQFLDSRIEQEEKRLVEKINRSIDKHEEDLTLSMHDFLASQWGRVAAKGLSKPAGSKSDSRGTKIEPAPALPANVAQDASGS